MQKKRFISRIVGYAAKLMKSGALRVYIQNNGALTAAELTAGTLCSYDYDIKSQKITIRKDEQGEQRVMRIARGHLLEVKTKMAAKTLGLVERVVVTFRKGMVIISPYKDDSNKSYREKSLIDAVASKKPLRAGSFFSGIGMLSYWIKKGLEQVGIRSQIAFANEMNPLAMDCNLYGNPIWDDATADASAYAIDLREVPLDQIPQLHLVEIGYPCIAQSTLCKADHRDLQHPIVGTLFVPVLAAIKQANPAIIIIENAPAFLNSQTLKLIEHELPGYRFEHRLVDAYEAGEIEGRKRSCVVGVSAGLPSIHLDFMRFEVLSRPTLANYLEAIELDAPCWQVYDHVKAKDCDHRVNYRNCVHSPSDTKIATIPASYWAKAGVPFVAHPTEQTKQRLLSIREHMNIRQLPNQMKSTLTQVEQGTHPEISGGSKTAIHRMLGNGVSKNVWLTLGQWIGNYINALNPQAQLSF